MRRETRDPRHMGRNPLPTILIVGDGHSEKRYFEDIRSYVNGYSLMPMVAGETGIGNIIEKIDGKLRYSNMDKSAGDRVVIVTDLDDRYTYSQMESLMDLCDRRGYELYLSNPCFESWLILHYIPNRKGGSAQDLVDRLKDVRDGHYSKSKGIGPSSEMVRTALLNARRIQGKDECTPSWCIRHNPSTMVHELVESISPEINADASS